ncbi:MAG: phage holin family protein [bacterium]|nr:phage holin family protein [bacterium]
MTTLALLLATWILPGFSLDRSHPRWWAGVLLLPLLFSAMMIVMRPVLLLLTFPLNSLTLGLPTLFFNGIILYFSAMASRTLVITSFGEALLGAVIITAISATITGWLGVDEAYPFYQSLIFRLGRRFGPRPEQRPARGLLILQIDGLSRASLRRALARGRMPAVSAMLARGTHKLDSWHCGIPSNTPAVQAGFFYGDRGNVPGYRWFDRHEQRLRVVSQPEDLRRLERMVAVGNRPLLEGGSCINTFMSGGAAKRLMAVSALGEDAATRRLGEQADFNLFFLSPSELTKAVLAFVWDYLAGLSFAVAGRFDKKRPRLRFSPRRAGQRALANAFLRELSFFWLKQDMVRSVPVIYSNFVGYDEVAHYSGPDTVEAQLTLAAFDRKLRILGRRARRQSPINYDIMLMSDHGQTPSVPFRILYGSTLEATLADMLGEGDGPGAPRRVFSPDSSYTLSLLAGMEEIDDSQLGWLARRSRRALVRLAPGQPGGADEAAAGAKVVVCVSGSLAHIYFTGSREPLFLEDVIALYPGLVEKLARHPGIGFVAARRRFGDAVAICEDGIRNLVTGQRGERNDPLAPYARRELWAGELARLLGYPDSGDLVINGAWLADQGRIVVMEEQASSHGGLGGRQTEPFVVLPAAWGVTRKDLESPEDLYRLVNRELERYRQGGMPGQGLPGSGTAGRGGRG